MTREEAHNETAFGLYGGIVDKIYDDFESRTCENCKYTEHVGSFSGVYMKCTNTESEQFDFNAPEDFGCNKFERKEESK